MTWASPTRATEPRGYDRRFYARALLVGFLFILLAIATLIYSFASRTVTVPPEAAYDLRSLFVEGGARLPDASNPCMVLQGHLEAIRTGRFGMAYGYLCEGLKREVSFEGFVENAKANNLLFRVISRYSFPSCDEQDGSAGASGYIYYRADGRSRVEAAFAKEGTAWRIARMTVVYE